MSSFYPRCSARQDFSVQSWTVPWQRRTPANAPDSRSRKEGRQRVLYDTGKRAERSEIGRGHEHEIGREGERPLGSTNGHHAIFRLLPQSIMGRVRTGPALSDVVAQRCHSSVAFRMPLCSKRPHTRLLAAASRSGTSARRACDQLSRTRIHSLFFANASNLMNIIQYQTIRNSPPIPIKKGSIFPHISG